MAFFSITSFIFPPFSSPILTALSLVMLVSIPIFGILEIRGKHLQYSKFLNASKFPEKIRLPSRNGMLFLYTPAFVAGILSFLLFPQHDESRVLIIKSAIVLHFFKRILEVLFLHKYSSKMDLDIAIQVSFSYLLFTTVTIYAQIISQKLPEPQIDLKQIGLIFYLIGIIGNFYHHIILSKLRKEGEKEYKIPRGGLFELVICPHYLFEIIQFLGISFISQTFFSFVFTVGSTVYLITRSNSTRNWYISKFEDFPKHIKAIVPFVF